MIKKKKVAIIGTNGIPAGYGGYETLAECLTQHLSNRFDFVVYCSKNQPRNYRTFNNSRLIYLPFKANGVQSIIYDMVSMVHAMCTSDVLLILGPAAGFFIPFIKIFKKNIIVNHGGLNEWEREKYNQVQKFTAKIFHMSSAKFASINISDNSFLQTSLKNSFKADSVIIRYGGDHVSKIEINSFLQKKYPFLTEKYSVSVSRAQIDNNLHVVLEAFNELEEYKLVLVSNWNASNYGIDLKKKYLGRPNLILLDAIYDKEEINAIRGNAAVYIHSHSYCGTSPSLVEAMFLGLPILSFDVPTNRETTKGSALYFRDSKGLKELLVSTDDLAFESIGTVMKNIADEEYTWSYISEKYAKLFNNKF